jgi:UDP:flavonoid glycosyltransferase YjiC (YdhE family)
MSALEHGVPVLGAGSREGKNDINARLDHLGLGVDLGTERPTADQLRTGLRRVLHDRRIAQNVERIREEFAAHRPLDIIDHCLAEDGLFAPSPR